MGVQVGLQSSAGTQEEGVQRLKWDRRPELSGLSKPIWIVWGLGRCLQDQEICKYKHFLNVFGAKKESWALRMETLEGKRPRIPQ